MTTDIGSPQHNFEVCIIKCVNYIKTRPDEFRNLTGTPKRFATQIFDTAIVSPSIHIDKPTHITTSFCPRSNARDRAIVDKLCHDARSHLIQLNRGRVEMDEDKKEVTIV